MILTLITDCRRACPDARTDSALVSAVRSWLAHAIDAGIDDIQVRERDLAAGVLRDLVTGLVADAGGTSTRILVNDRADVALVAGADGVHLRADGWPAATVRGLSSSAWRIGRSVHGPVEEAAGLIDYAILGAVFGSGPKPARGLDLLRAVAAASPVPVLAVGGVTPATARLCGEAGAGGVAAIRPFLPSGSVPGALGPRTAIREMRTAAEFFRYSNGHVS